MAPRVAEHGLAELAGVFLKLGTTAFGGPAAHLAMMEHEFVRRRGWLTREELLDLIGAASMIPGPSSTEVAIYIGHRRAGWRGLLLAGICFILPAALMVTALAYLYVRLGRLPRADALLAGVKAVVIAIIAQALVSLARAAVKSPALVVLGVAAVGASVAGAPPLAVLAGAGLLNVLLAAARGGAVPRPAALVLGAGTTAGAVAGALPVTLVKLFLVFLKVGALVFGSGYVLLAFLRADVVNGTHWLTERQLLDAVAVGQVTPGPVFTTATFIGYLVAGPAGAALATVAIFLPSFVLVAVTGPILSRIRRAPASAAFLDGVNVGAVALVGVVCWQLARAALVDPTTIAVAVAGFLALVVWKPNSAWLVAAGAVAGLVRG